MGVAQPLRKTSKKDQTRLGTYPIPPEAYVWWQNRYRVPGGEIKQSFSPYQQKIMWQYLWNLPSRWYWRYSKWAWPIGTSLFTSHASKMWRQTSVRKLGGDFIVLHHCRP